EYDNERYSPGDTVSAKVSIHASKAPTKICCIKISVVGCAVVKWTERESKSKIYESTCSARHSYISLSERLWSPPNGEKWSELPVGSHSFTHR
ncbi:hypothetical protein PMAYCL1PPCAC_02451, partial [Pristionchus mayeri]